MKQINLNCLIKIFITILSLIISTSAMASPAFKVENQNVTNFNKNNTAVSSINSIVDGASLLNQSDLQSLISKIQRIETKHGIQIGIITQKTIDGQSVSRVADALLDSYFSNANNGGIVLLIVMDTRDWYISTNSTMSQRITNNAGFPYLQNQFVSRLSEGNYSSAFNNYVDTIDGMYNYYEANGHAYDPSNEFNPIALMAAIVISIFLGVMIRSSLIGSMSNVRPAVEASEYLDKNSFRLTENRDTFLFMNVKHTAKKSRSSGGRGHSGGGGGGHGGGGGKF